MLLWMEISDWYLKVNMIIETIKSYIHPERDKVTIRQYKTMVDDNNKRYLQIVEHYFTPYNAFGKQTVEDSKGVNFDKKA